jgi:hypothetical protein
MSEKACGSSAEWKEGSERANGEKTVGKERPDAHLVCVRADERSLVEVSSSRPKGLWEVGTFVLRMWFSGGTSILKPPFWDPNFVTFWGILLIASGKRFFEFVKNHRFQFFKYFRIRESWIPVVWKASKNCQLFDWFFDFKKFDNSAYMPKPVNWKFWGPVGKWICTWVDIW